MLKVSRIVIAWKEFTVKGTRVPYLFRSYEHPKHDGVLYERNPDSNIDYPIWQVARATSAAPTYFKAVKLKPKDEEFEFIDGGLGANNPSEEVYQSVEQLSKNHRGAVSELVSIGTGKSTEKGKNHKTGYRLYLKYANAAIQWAAQSEATHERMGSQTRKDGTNYSRLNVEQGLAKVKLDTWKGKKGARTLKLIRAETRKYLESDAAQEKIRGVAERVVQIRRCRAAQAESDQWERFCHGVRYVCRESQGGERVSKYEDLHRDFKIQLPRAICGTESAIHKDYRLFE